MSRLLLIDNYDSFTYNLYQYLCELGAEVTVIRNDKLTIDDVEAMQPDGIVLSPGPGRPEDAGVCIPVIARFVGQVPILGVCLGHQALAAAWGGRIVRAAEPRHGRTSLIEHDRQGLFEGLPSPLKVCRYHSLVVDEPSLPPVLQVTARSEDGAVMALAHASAPVFGVQFHPESALTPDGYRLLANFLHLAGCPVAADPHALAASEKADPANVVYNEPARPLTF